MLNSRAHLDENHSVVSELPCISEFLLRDTLSFLSDEVIISWKQEMKKKKKKKKKEHVEAILSNLAS